LTLWLGKKSSDIKALRGRGGLERINRVIAFSKVKSDCEE